MNKYFETIIFWYRCQPAFFRWGFPALWLLFIVVAWCRWLIGD